MRDLPDAPWIRDPERYADAYYYRTNDEEDEDESEMEIGDPD